jgi:hypothetical protein
MMIRAVPQPGHQARAASPVIAVGLRPLAGPLRFSLSSTPAAKHGSRLVVRSQSEADLREHAVCRRQRILQREDDANNG